MYQNTAAIIRHDLNAFVEEASAVDKLFIGEKLLPVYSVPTRAGIFPKIKTGTGDLLKKEATLRAPTGTYNETIRKFETDTYECIDRGLEERIDDVTVRDYSRFFDVEVLTSKLIMRQVKMDYESRVLDSLLGTAAVSALSSQISAGTSGTTNGAIANIATYDFPVAVLQAISALRARGEEPNTMVMSQQQFDFIRRTTLLNTFLFGNIATSGVGTKIVNSQDLAKTFGISNVYISSAHYDAGGRMASGSLTALWPNQQYVWIGNVQGGEVSAGGCGRTIVWSKDGSGLFTTETYRSEPRRGDMVRVRHHTDEKIVNLNAVQLINGGAAIGQ
jgi:hypothetical protein